MLFFLMIPLIVVAWQYSFRYVAFYAISLAIVEIGVGLVVKFYLDVDIRPYSDLIFHSCRRQYANHVLPVVKIKSE